jgi:hypothetical protein
VVQRQVDSRRVAARPLHQGGGRRATVRPGDQVAPPSARARRGRRPQRVAR